jgi:O-antigen/teichoic acid export membrane protein
MRFLDFHAIAGSVGFRRFIRLFSVDALVKVSTVLLVPVYLKLMTQSEFGLYSYLVNAAGTLGLVFNFGLYIPQTKLYHESNDEQQRGRLLFTIVALLAGLALTTLGLAYLFGLDQRAMRFLVSVPFDYSRYRPWLLTTMLVGITSLMLFNYLMASEQIRLMQRYNVLRLFGAHGVVLTLLLLLDQDKILIRLKYAAMADGILIGLFGIAYVRRMRWSFDPHLAKRALRLALPIQVSAVLGVVINFGDRFFLEKYGTPVDLSVYYLAISISSSLPLILVSLQNVWMPLFLKEKDLAANVARTARLARFMLVGFLFIALATIAAVKLALLVGIFDAKYAPVMKLLPIVLLTQLVTALVPIYGNYFIYFDKTYLMTIVGLAVAGLGVASNLVLTTRLKTYGAALSALVCNLAYLVAYLLLAKHFVAQRLMSREGKPPNALIEQ